jgi:hypothetical protein
MELAINLVIIGMIQPGEPDRSPQLLQYLQVFIKTALRDAHLPGEIGWRARSFLADKLVQAEEEAKVLLHKRRFRNYLRSINRI